jgi:NADPH:quinone reductase-like Zn-dependent oxidoreductase
MFTDIWDVWPLLEARKVVPVIDSTFPFERAAEAHARMESSLGRARREHLVRAHG